MKTFLSLPLCLLLTGAAFSQEPSATKVPVTISRSVKPTFGDQQQAVGDYLTQHITSELPSKRAAFSLLIDHKGNVVEAKPFFASLGAAADAEVVRVFASMPAWKTTASEGTVSRVLVVVKVSQKQITTEIH